MLKKEQLCGKVLNFCCSWIVVFMSPEVPYFQIVTQNCITFAFLHLYPPLTRSSVTQKLGSIVSSLYLSQRANTDSGPYGAERQVESLINLSWGLECAPKKTAEMTHLCYLQSLHTGLVQGEDQAELPALRHYYRIQFSSKRFDLLFKVRLWVPHIRNTIWSRH